MSDTEEYGLFFRNIVIRLIRFERFNCFLTFCLFLVDETEFFVDFKNAVYFAFAGE